MIIVKIATPLRRMDMTHTLKRIENAAKSPTALQGFWYSKAKERGATTARNVTSFGTMRMGLPVCNTQVRVERGETHSSFHAVHSRTNPSPSATMEKVIYNRRVSLVPSNWSATTKKRRVPGTSDALRRALRPISMDTKIDNTTVARKTSTEMVMGDQEGEAGRAPESIVRMLMSASTSKGISHGRGSAKPAM
jgi:hypothetical protein